MFSWWSPRCGKLLCRFCNYGSDYCKCCKKLTTWQLSDSSKSLCVTIRVALTTARAVSRIDKIMRFFEDDKARWWQSVQKIFFGTTTSHRSGVWGLWGLGSEVWSLKLNTEVWGRMNSYPDISNFKFWILHAMFRGSMFRVPGERIIILAHTYSRALFQERGKVFLCL